MVTRCVVALFIALFFALTPATVTAQYTPRGLTISPVRQEITVVPGGTATGSFIIGNSSEKPMIVDISVEQFSVADYSYDYEFRAPPSYDWVKFPQKQVELEPNKSRKVIFSVTVPEKAPPGGYYFSLFASTTLEGPGLPGTVRAASLLYTKVDGELVRTGVMENASVPLWVFGGEVPYEFDVKNTGNVHFSAYFYGQLTGLFGSLPEVGTSHLLMPDAVRTIEGSVPTPFFPGIYKMTYGYKVDFADIITTKSGYIIFIPPWSIIALVIFSYGVWWVWQRRLSLLQRLKQLKKR